MTSQKIQQQQQIVNSALESACWQRQQVLSLQASQAFKQGYIELLADLENKKADSNFEYFSIEIIDDYLAYRKMMWEKGEKYTKDRFGFIS